MAVTPMYNEVVKITKSEFVQNEYGDTFDNADWDNAKEIFCEIASISQSEFYAAVQSGFKPTLKVKIADYYDYDNEDLLLYNSEEYNIIRTYRNGTSIELTAESRADNGK